MLFRAHWRGWLRQEEHYGNRKPGEEVVKGGGGDLSSRAPGKNLREFLSDSFWSQQKGTGWYLFGVYLVAWKYVVSLQRREGR